MSDAIKHECGIAVIRLLKPLSYYQQKYGSHFYGLQKMYLLGREPGRTVKPIKGCFLSLHYPVEAKVK